MRHHRVARPVLLLVAGALLVSGAGPALAHQDGCHRRHSCPSDTGKYVCGDKGDFSQCGSADTAYEEPEYEEPAYEEPAYEEPAYEEPAPPAPPPDLQAPAAPAVAGVTSRAGRVDVRVTAEQGARLAVIGPEGRELTAAVASGVEQVLRFSDVDGSRDYRITATDAAGNVSVAASATAVVDGTAPRPTLAVTPPGRGVISTTVRLRGERGARFALRVLHRGGAVLRAHSRDGVLDGGEEVLELSLPNGDYEVSATLADAAGNSATTASPVGVAVPAPVLRLARTSPATTGATALTVEGPSQGRGVVRLVREGQGVPVTKAFVLDASGSADVVVDLDDGVWDASAEVEDAQQRTATARLSELLVDTVAPRPEPRVDEQRARELTVALTLRVDEDASVVVRGLPGGEQRFSDPGEVEVVEQAAQGEHRLTVVATDAAGNVTEVELVADVSRPATASDLMLFFGFLALLGLGTWRLVRRVRRRLRRRRQPATAQLPQQRSGDDQVHALQEQPSP